MGISDIYVIKGDNMKKTLRDCVRCTNMCECIYHNSVGMYVPDGCELTLQDNHVINGDNI